MNCVSSQQLYVVFFFVFVLVLVIFSTRAQSTPTAEAANQDFKNRTISVDDSFYQRGEPYRSFVLGGRVGPSFLYQLDDEAPIDESDYGSWTAPGIEMGVTLGYRFSKHFMLNSDFNYVYSSVTNSWDEEFHVHQFLTAVKTDFLFGIRKGLPIIAFGPQVSFTCIKGKGVRGTSEGEPDFEQFLFGVGAHVAISFFRSTTYTLGVDSNFTKHFYWGVMQLGITMQFSKYF